MPRPARSILPSEGVYHVTARGVARQSIYRDDEDRLFFLRQLNLARRRWRWLLFAYCLMGNHYHLVVVADLDRLSRGMHLLNFRYAQKFNERHERTGHLFGDRFGARVIDEDEHFLTVAEYVFDNPVRAGICARREDWPWLGGELLGEVPGGTSPS